MWILHTRGRGAQCQEALDAFARCGSTPGMVYVHSMNTLERAQYDALALPPGWMREDGEEYIGGQSRLFFDRHPDEPWYGVLADDNRPETPDFDLKMIEAAGRWKFVSCDGGRKKRWPSIQSAMVWGGDLVRAVGWFAPPGIIHATRDEHWKAIAGHAGVIEYLPDVMVRHPHWQDGRRKRDHTDLEPKRHWGHDFRICDDFKNAEAKATANRVLDAMRADP